MRWMASSRPRLNYDGYAVLFPGGRSEFRSRDSAYVGAAKMILTYSTALTDDQRNWIRESLLHPRILTMQTIYKRHGSDAGVKVIAIARS